MGWLTAVVERIVLSAVAAVTGNIDVIMIPFLIALVVIYITALVFSKKTKCVIIWGLKDLIVLALLAITLIVIVMITVEEQNGFMGAVILVLVIASVALLVWTILLSVFSNSANLPPANIFYIALSILTKLILLAIIPVIVFLYLGYNSDSGYKKDRRYRDGTRGNQKLKALAILFLVAGLIFVPLIKKDKSQ